MPNLGRFVNKILPKLSEIGDFSGESGAVADFEGDCQECGDLRKTGEAGSHQRQMWDSRLQGRAIWILKVGSGDDAQWKRVGLGAWAQTAGPVLGYRPRIRYKLTSKM